MAGLRECDAFMDRLKKTLELASKYGVEEALDIEKYKGMAASVCESEQIFLRLQHVIGNVEQMENVTNDLFNEMIEQEDGKERPDVTQLERYQRFEREFCSLAQMREDDDPATNQVHDDDFVMEDVIQETDPITKEPLINPVRNNKCNHIYGKESMTESIKMNPNVRCPIVGCTNRHIALSDLVEDEEYARKLQMARHQRNAASEEY